MQEIDKIFMKKNSSQNLTYHSFLSKFVAIQSVFYQNYFASPIFFFFPNLNTGKPLLPKTPVFTLFFFEFLRKLIGQCLTGLDPLPFKTN